jgi:hypothetical protein
VAALAPEALADPLGVVVDLVEARHVALERATIEEVVVGVASGRAKRRRLAQALLERRSVLADGRSPAPRVVGDLLIALRKAGTSNISSPVCASCAKPLGSLPRRGEDWYCGVCGPVRDVFTSCGKTRAVTFRDRDRRPRCGQCPPGDGRDPTDVVIDVVTSVDPTLRAEVVIAALNNAVTNAGQRRQLAWALADRPELLTGAGTEAPVPSVLRFIDGLCDAGAMHIVRPPCPHCGRVIALVKPRDGVRLCRNCVAKSRAEPCARCGVVREAATPDDHGRPLCAYCLITNPANLEICTSCRRRRPVSVRGPDGVLCAGCRPWKSMTCAICARFGPAMISKTTGTPWYAACAQRWVRCVGCGEVAPLWGGTTEEPLCATCTRPAPGFWRSCTDCGRAGRIHTGRCARCGVQRRLRELLGDEQGQIRPGLGALYEASVSLERPDTAAAWLDNATVFEMLRGLDAGKVLTHEMLDGLPAGKSLEHLRSVLVAIGTLPQRDEQMERLQRWIAAIIAARSDPEEQQLLHRYVTWHVLRRLRRRLGDAETTHAQAVSVQEHVRGAITLLDVLGAHHLDLGSAPQGDLEAWLVSEQSTHCREARHFVRWAKREKLTSLEFPAVRWGGPSGVIDNETRWVQARWLLHDDTVKPEDRFAGLLVLFYAQWPAAISRLTLARIEANDRDVRLRLGPSPVVLPEPLAGLTLHLVATRQGHAVLGHQACSPWLFPGGQPGRSISAFRLGERLRQLGLRPGQSRSTALFQLTTELPAALLARMLGIHISVAVAWQRASAGDWTDYAAYYSRRGDRRESKPLVEPPHSPL